MPIEENFFERFLLASCCTQYCCFGIRYESSTIRNMQVVKRSIFYFMTAWNPNCASKGKESEKVTVMGVVGSYDSGGTAVIVYSCLIQAPGDQIKMLNQPSPLLESGSGPHFWANMPRRSNWTPSRGGSDTSHRPSPLRSCQAATSND